jgi:hypothetical protein
MHDWKLARVWLLHEMRQKHRCLLGRQWPGQASALRTVKEK